MNHDHAHCLDSDSHCPKTCFRKQLFDDLARMDGRPSVSWIHFKDTDECIRYRKKTERREDET